MNQKEQSYSINGNNLEILKSSARVAFPLSIAEVLEFDNVFFVRLEVEAGIILNENIVAVSQDGSVVWRLPERKHVYKDSPYVLIAKEKNLLKAVNWDGEYLLIDPDTFELVSFGYGK